MSFEKINNLVGVSTAKYGLARQSQAARICFEAETLYKDLFHPISFKNGVLKAGVKSSIEAAELRFQTEEMIKKINQKIGSNLVNKIRFVIV